VKATRFTQELGIEIPLICGPMYPCSNPELVAAVSESGAIGVVQPLSLIYVYNYNLRDGLKYIRQLTQKPYGFNVLTEASSKKYIDRMKSWVDIALEEGCRFFITALGNPRWIVDRVKSVNGIVYHDVTELKWAQKALDAGVDGFICVNNRAGGHTGIKSASELFMEISPLKKTLVCAGGVGDETDFRKMLEVGYDAVQMGTRFIATQECRAHEDYKRAIVASHESDIFLTKKITGVPVSVIRTPSVEKLGEEVGVIMKFMLSHPRLKHWARLYYSLKSLWSLKRASLKGLSYKDFWQAGKSVEHIHKIESVSEIITRFSKGVSGMSRF
jgi:nitronate monooxygenase